MTLKGIHYQWTAYKDSSVTPGPKFSETDQKLGKTTMQSLSKEPHLTSPPVNQSQQTCQRCRSNISQLPATLHRYSTSTNPGSRPQSNQNATASCPFSPNHVTSDQRTLPRSKSRKRDDMRFMSIDRTIGSRSHKPVANGKVICDPRGTVSSITATTAPSTTNNNFWLRLWPRQTRSRRLRDAVRPTSSSTDCSPLLSTRLSTNVDPVRRHSTNLSLCEPITHMIPTDIRLIDTKLKKGLNGFGLTLVDIIALIPSCFATNTATANYGLINADPVKGIDGDAHRKSGLCQRLLQIRRVADSIIMPSSTSSGTVLTRLNNVQPGDILLAVGGHRLAGRPPDVAASLLSRVCVGQLIDVTLLRGLNVASMPPREAVIGGRRDVTSSQKTNPDSSTLDYVSKLSQLTPPIQAPSMSLDRSMASAVSNVKPEPDPYQHSVQHQRTGQRRFVYAKLTLSIVKLPRPFEFGFTLIQTTDGFVVDKLELTPSPLEANSVQVGDIIQAVGSVDVSVFNKAQLQRLLDQVPFGQPIPTVVYRVCKNCTNKDLASPIMPTAPHNSPIYSSTRPVNQLPTHNPLIAIPRYALVPIDCCNVQPQPKQQQMNTSRGELLAGQLHCIELPLVSTITSPLTKVNGQTNSDDCERSGVLAEAVRNDQVKNLGNMLVFDCFPTRPASTPSMNGEQEEEVNTISRGTMQSLLPTESMTTASNSTLEESVDNVVTDDVEALTERVGTITLNGSEKVEQIDRIEDRSENGVSVNVTTKYTSMDIQLWRNQDEGFGFVIISSISGNKASIIGKIIPNSPADRCGQLEVGQRIVAINGQELTGLHHEQIVRLVRESGQQLTLTISSSSPPSSNSASFSRKSESMNATDLPNTVTSQLEEKAQDIKIPNPDYVK